MRVSKAAFAFALCAMGCQGTPVVESHSRPVVADLPSPRASAPEDRTLSPYFFVPDDDPEVDPLPLKSTHAQVQVAGTIADVRVTQVYKNEGKRTLEAVYVFPMSTRAAVHGMKMRVAGRTIEARIQDREQARAQYQSALRQGRTASLLEQDRPNVFRMNVANILPGDEIRVELSYVELIVPSDRVYELVFPTVVGPRYSTKNEPRDRSSQGPYLPAGVPAAHTFSLDAVVESPLPIQVLGCATHRVDIEFPSASQARVTLPEGDDTGNRDFILRWQLAGAAIQGGLLLGESDGEKYFLLAMEPPARVETSAIVPREYIFIVDVSGSMHGFPLDTAKRLMGNLLGGLRPSDRFNILSFSGGSQLYAPTSQPADAAHVHDAADFMEKMEAGGGTDLLPSLHQALALPRGDASRIVVVVTDGFVDVEKESFELVRRSLGQANLFAFGIGSSVNRFLIEGLARAGQGEAFVVTHPEAAAAAAERFQSYVKAPVLRNLRLEFEGFVAEDVTPLPDLFAERPLVIHGRYRGEPAGSLTISGQLASGAFSQTIDLASARHLTDGEPLRLLWARDRLTWLQDLSGAGDRDAHQDEITQLGLRNHLMTQYTSFVAVDSAVRANGNAATVEHPQPMPAGVSDSAMGNVSYDEPPQGNDAEGVLGTLSGSGSGYGAGGLSGRRAQASGIVAGAPQVRGSLDKEVIRRVVRLHLDEVRSCYEKARMTEPALAGRLVLKLTINAAGIVVSAVVQSSTLRNPAVEACAASAARGWSFPRPGGGLVIVTYPFQLDASR